MPSDSVIPSSLPYIKVGMDWSKAVREDPTLSRNVYAPEVTLDGKNLNEAESTAINFTRNVPVTSWGLTYRPDSPLSPGRHSMQIVVRDSREHVFTFEWEFCVKSE